MKRSILSALAALIVLAPAREARSFPIGVSMRAGIGVSYYSMGELDDHFNDVTRDYGVEIPDLTKGVNVMLQGRVWLYDFIAASGGFEHFWGESELETGSVSPITYKAPANVYTIGGALKAFSITDVLDVIVGVNGCFTKSTFGTNLLTSRRLSEYKANKWGMELFVEAASNFLNPVELSVQMGYRRLTVDGFEDKYGNPANFPDSTIPIALDYGGPFFYLTSGIRL